MLKILAFRLLFSEEYDNNNAILGIHAGAGNLIDARLGRNHVAYVWKILLKKQGLKYSYLNHRSGDIAGVKSATIKVEGDLLMASSKGEKNSVHRVIRISPFDPFWKRHTSFAPIGCYARIFRMMKSI